MTYSPNPKLIFQERIILDTDGNFKFVAGYSNV